MPNRQLSGDDVLLDYDISGAAARSQSGSGLPFNPDGPTVQRVASTHLLPVFMHVSLESGADPRPRGLKPTAHQYLRRDAAVKAHGDGCR
jgi:hypothetical protein